jgi:TonB family protein
MNKLFTVVGFLNTIVFSFALATGLPVAATQSQAKNPADSNNPQTGVVVVKLVAPIYPPLARATHIVGDVDLKLSIRQDGSLESATVVSGHPLLRAAALDSAQQTQFECRKCSEPTTSYRLVYTFQIEGECECEPVVSRPKTTELDKTYPQITNTTNRVTVTALVVCICDPAIQITKVRSLKCLYLWRCAAL